MGWETSVVRYEKNGYEFSLASELPKYESQVFARSIDFYHTPQRPKIDKAAKRLASCLGIINTHHSFPERNGRAQRIFISELAHVYQYSINWDVANPWEIIETSKQVHKVNYEPLENLIKRIIVDKS